MVVHAFIVAEHNLFAHLYVARLSTRIQLFEFPRRLVHKSHTTDSEYRRTTVHSSIEGYLSGSVHIVSFLPSLASFNEISFSKACTGALSFGKAAMMSFKIGDRNPVSPALGIRSKAIAILLNAGNRIASSCGVH